MAVKTIGVNRGNKRPALGDAPGALAPTSIGQGKTGRPRKVKSVEDQIIDMYNQELERYRKEETEKDLAELRLIENG